MPGSAVADPELPPEVIAQVVADDEALSNRAKGLVHAMFDEIEHMLDPRYGAPAATRQKLVATALPAIMRELREEKVDDRLVEMQRQQAQMMQAIRQVMLNPAAGQVGPPPVTAPPVDEG